MGSSKSILWATLLMYNLIRLEMAVADEAKVQPCRISFITALRYIVDGPQSSGSHLPCAELAMRKNIRRFVLPPRRSHRRYPREVRMTKTQYPFQKCRSDLTERHCPKTGL